MNIRRKTGLFLVMILAFGGIMYLWVKRADSEKNNFYAENTGEKNIHLEPKENRAVETEIKQPEGI